MENEEIPILNSEVQHEIEMPKVSEKSSLLTAQLSCASTCAFSKHEHTTLESQERSESATKLGGLIVFYLLVMLVEIVGGLKANSLAVITDAGHLLTDVAGFAISLFSVWASGWKATPYQSFGYHRLEVLGALLSVQLIWLISGLLIYEAVGRILHKSERVNGILMFAIAAFGFVVNFIMVVWLGHHNHTHHGCAHSDHDHDKEEVGASTAENTKKILNINLQGAYLHVMVDMIQSVGVMIAGGIIWAKPDWLVVDLICTLIFSVLSLSTTIPMLKNIYGILMERIPNDIDVTTLEKDLKSIKGVQDVHDLHVWALTVGKSVLSCHVIAEPAVNSRLLVHKIRDYCETTHRIHHVTIQIE
ncbi:Metal tolerance protein B [Morus notabilis]|uniref:MTP4 protein n=1 Tax=Morus notabilis TaxID=981085 RepID=W9SIY0_9ROSA|nr:metal tolerance protein B [Morus notabilis]XP_024028114.1 metal tolerance protein B [Morus notabilis]AYW01681.1 MTP4 protein [Morus notabilis]EXC10736.1 Metal tolerance protein B [Morus notabilis]